MKTNLITEEIISEKLRSKGIPESYYKADENDAWEMVAAHFDAKVDDIWTRNTYDFYCYAETTADNYEVWVATTNPDSICIGEDIYYYTSELSGPIYEAIINGNHMYIDDTNEHYFLDAVEDAYELMVNNIKEEIEEELIERGYGRDDANN